jgi:hypothetical protein
MILKPVTIINTRYTKYRQNTTQQVLLLKALKITQDPKELKKMIGVRTVAEVYRTLDKMALRKEYHKSLQKAGIDFNYIINGLKNESQTAPKSADRIKVYQILLKSLGMESYQDAGDAGGGSWEELIASKLEQNKEVNSSSIIDSSEIKKLSAPNTVYDVKVPKVPDSIKKKQEKEYIVAKSLYE